MLKQGKKHLIIAIICLAVFTVAGISVTAYLKSGGKTLIVYFTRVGNTDFSEDVDAVSSASINRNSNGKLEGNSELIAKQLQLITGGDLYAIDTKEKYPQSYDETVRRASAELSEKARPKLINDIENIEQYDRIILVYPIWWGTLPTPVFTFLEKYDFSGKEILPVATHKGSFLGNSVEDIKELLPEAEVKIGIPVAGGSAKFLLWIPIMLFIAVLMIIGGDFIRKVIKKKIIPKIGIAVQLLGVVLLIFGMVRILI